MTDAKTRFYWKTAISSFLGFTLLAAAALALAATHGCGPTRADEHGEAYSLVKKTVAASRELQSVVGAPVNSSGEPIESTILLDEEVPSAMFRFEISGPRGSGEAKATTEKKDGKWRITSLSFSMPEGRGILDLMPVAAGDPASDGGSGGDDE